MNLKYWSLLSIIVITCAFSSAAPSITTTSSTNIQISGLAPFQDGLKQLNTTLENAAPRIFAQLGFVAMGVGLFCVGLNYLRKKETFDTWRGCFLTGVPLVTGLALVYYSAQLAHWGQPKLTSV